MCSEPDSRPSAPRSFSFLINPLSGGGAGPAAVIPVTRILRDAGAKVDVTYSSGPAVTREVVELAVSRGQVVVAVGGDGMLSSVAGLVSNLGGTLGLVPAGRGNDFFSMLGLSRTPEDIAHVLLCGNPTPTDLLSLRLGGDSVRLIVGSVYAGVDAVAGELVDKARWLPQKLQYPYAAVRSLATYRPFDARVVVDGEERTFRAATVVVANSAYYGAGMKIAPSASIDDGILDVVVIEAATRRLLLRALPKAYDGSHVDLPEVHVMRGHSVQVSGSPAAPVGGDGELLGHLPGDSSRPAVIDVMPGALSLLLPA